MRMLVARYRGWRRLSLLFALAAACLAGLSAAQAQPSEASREQARALVREAGQFLERGDRGGAVARLQQAQRLHPDPTIDYNLGIVYAEMNKPTEAAQSFERFLRGADRSRILGDRLEDAKLRLAVYEKSLSRLEVQATLPAGGSAAMLYIDQLPATALPLSGALWLPPGNHGVRVTAPGAREYLVTLELQPGEQRRLTAELRATSEPQLAMGGERYSAQEAAPPFYKKWWFWTAVGGGAVVLVGLIAAGASGRFDYLAPGTDLTPVEVAR